MCTSASLGFPEKKLAFASFKIKTYIYILFWEIYLNQIVPISIEIAVIVKEFPYVYTCLILKNNNMCTV